MNAPLGLKPVVSTMAGTLHYGSIGTDDMNLCPLPEPRSDHFKSIVYWQVLTILFINLIDKFPLLELLPWEGVKKKT